MRPAISRHPQAAAARSIARCGSRSLPGRRACAFVSSRRPTPRPRPSTTALAENLLVFALHPLDQFKAFKRMFDMGMSKKERSPTPGGPRRAIMQRLRLRHRRRHLTMPARNEMTLAMLESLTVNPRPHERQHPRSRERISTSWQKEPWQIRNMLTGPRFRLPISAPALSASAYETAAGPVLRQTSSPRKTAAGCRRHALDRLVDEKVRAIADEIAGRAPEDRRGGRVALRLHQRLCASWPVTQN